MGRGQQGEGITETTMKDTWTKSRRRVEVGLGARSAGVGWRDGEKMQTTVIEKQKLKKKRAVLLGLLFKLPYLHLTKMSVREILLSPFLQ